MLLGVHRFPLRETGGGLDAKLTRPDKTRESPRRRGARCPQTVTPPGFRGCWTQRRGQEGGAGASRGGVSGRRGRSRDLRRWELVCQAAAVLPFRSWGRIWAATRKAGGRAWDARGPRRGPHPGQLRTFGPPRWRIFIKRVTQMSWPRFVYILGNCCGKGKKKKKNQPPSIYLQIQESALLRGRWSRGRWA